MKYHSEANAITEPTLEEMTRVAIKMLQKEDKGYYLFVEGGRIDMAHHHNWARRALDETVEFHKAVQVYSVKYNHISNISNCTCLQTVILAVNS